MAKEYFDKLSKLIDELKLREEIATPIEVKHFFSGAALHVDCAICASWSPVGLAFKLPGDDAEKLIASGEAMPLKYFPQGHTKKGYALFEDAGNKPASEWRAYFIKAARQR